MTKVTTKLISLQAPGGCYEEVFLVDTGATDSMAPGDELEKIGVRRAGKMSYELADGTVKEYPYGLVRIEFMGETTPNSSVPDASSPNLRQTETGSSQLFHAVLAAIPRNQMRTRQATMFSDNLR